LASLCQRILVIDVTEAVQRSRAGARDGQTPESIDRIIAVQIARHNRLALADDIVVNDGELTHLYPQLQAKHEQYLKMCALEQDSL